MAAYENLKRSLAMEMIGEHEPFHDQGKNHEGVIDTGQNGAAHVHQKSDETIEEEGGVYA